MLDTMLDVVSLYPARTARLQQRNWRGWALAYLYIFRALVVGSCLGIAVVAWLTHVEWLLMASICIAAGEFLETTYYIIVLTWGRDLTVPKRAERGSPVGA